MVDYKNAFSVEEKVMSILSKSPDLKKYKLGLHENGIYGIDIVSKASGYEDFAIEVESTQGDKWPSSAPYPTTWKKFSVPARKQKFYIEYPMSLFVKVNRDVSRAAVIPMCYVFSHDEAGYKNENQESFKCNEFYVIFNEHHPALCFCKIRDLPFVVDEHFKHMMKLKRVNSKYTDMRPTFKKERKKK